MAWDSPYSRGLEAGWNLVLREIWTDNPEVPGTPEYEEWENGRDDGIHDAEIDEMPETQRA